ncbi:MAG TPA: hypothetical protein VI542_15685 [Candidatus Tectomicrobia bacterium]
MPKPTPSALFPTISHRKKRALLLAYAETGKLREACRTAYVDTKLHYYWKHTDPDYAVAYAEAQRAVVFALRLGPERRQIVVLVAAHELGDKDFGAPSSRELVQQTFGHPCHAESPGSRVEAADIWLERITEG